jgi:hypothetical protein
MQAQYNSTIFPGAKCLAVWFMSPSERMSFPCCPVGNCLQHIPAAVLCSLTTLTDLNLSGNQLTSLPDPLGPYPSLVKLSVHGNQLSHLPEEGWSAMTSLDELCVQGNTLQQLPLQIGQLAVSVSAVVQPELHQIQHPCECERPTCVTFAMHAPQRSAWF